ncbi:MAG: SpoIIE family protein phosphatase [Planctomycetota bacterium]|nr:SpoIIE family protein phosphatase [Planctomycetota bacterium]
MQEEIEGIHRGISIAGIRRFYPGEDVCGDDWLICESSDALIVALIDGLGHGPKAQEASLATCKHISELVNADAPAPSLESIMESCHGAIRRTRGAAVALLRLSEESSSFLSVGNVALRLSDGHKSGVICHAGIVGRRSRPHRAFPLVWPPESSIYLFTDGISSRFQEPPSHLSPRQCSKQLLKDFGKDSDDASILVLRRAS